MGGVAHHKRLFFVKPFFRALSVIVRVNRVPLRPLRGIAPIRGRVGLECFNGNVDCLADDERINLFRFSAATPGIEFLENFYRFFVRHLLWL